MTHRNRRTSTKFIGATANRIRGIWRLSIRLPDGTVQRERFQSTADMRAALKASGL